MNVNTATAIAVPYSMVDPFSHACMDLTMGLGSFLTTNNDIELTCYSGHVIILPQDIASFVTSLPRPAQRMCSSSLVPRPHGKASGLGTLLFQICSAVNEIHSFLRT